MFEVVYTVEIEKTSQINAETVKDALETMESKDYNKIKSIKEVPDDDEVWHIQSSWIEKISYNYGIRTLKVDTINGNYLYLDVPSNLVLEMAKAESAGKFFNEKIKGKFERGEIENG